MAFRHPLCDMRLRVLARFSEQLLDDVEGFDEVRVLEVAEVADAEDLAFELALAAAEHDAKVRAAALEEAAQKVALDWLDTLDRRAIADRLRALANTPEVKPTEEPHLAMNPYNCRCVDCSRDGRR